MFRRCILYSHGFRSSQLRVLGVADWPCVTKVSRKMAIRYETQLVTERFETECLIVREYDGRMLTTIMRSVGF